MQYWDVHCSMQGCNAQLTTLVAAAVGAAASERDAERRRGKVAGTASVPIKWSAGLCATLLAARTRTLAAPCKHARTCTQGAYRVQPVGMHAAAVQASLDEVVAEASYERDRSQMEAASPNPTAL